MTIRFTIPAAVALALPLGEMGNRAEEFGLAQTTFRFDQSRLPSGDVAVLCARPMATFLLFELRALASRPDVAVDNNLSSSVVLAIEHAKTALAASRAIA